MDKAAETRLGAALKNARKLKAKTQEVVALDAACRQILGHEPRPHWLFEDAVPPFVWEVALHNAASLLTEMASQAGWKQETSFSPRVFADLVNENFLSPSKEGAGRDALEKAKLFHSGLWASTQNPCDKKSNALWMASQLVSLMGNFGYESSKPLQGIVSDLMHVLETHYKPSAPSVASKAVAPRP